MRLTTRTSLALRTLMFCAVNNDRIVRKYEIAERCNVSENHLAQVVNGLSHAGYLQTIRGRRGGMRLSRPMDAISVGAVARSFEGGVPREGCFAGGTDDCTMHRACRLRGALARAVSAFYKALDDVTLADLVDCNDGLEELLSLESQLPPGAAESACTTRAA